MWCGELLAKVQSFLPKIAKANEAMRDVAASRGKESVDIEQLVSETEPYVEMNLAVAPSEVAGRVEKALSKAAAADAEGDSSEDGGDSEAEEEAPDTFEDPAKKAAVSAAFATALANGLRGVDALEMTGSVKSTVFFILKNEFR